MLPFMAPKKITSIIIAKRKPDGGLDPKGDEDGIDPGLMSAAEDIISAVHAKDATALVHALKAAIEMADDDSEEPEPEPEMGEE